MALDEAQSNVANDPLPSYFIEDGVHRAIAARENNLSALPAIFYEQGKSPKLIFVGLDQLYSPKATINRSDPRHQYSGLEIAMGTVSGRAQIPPISVQALGIHGQPFSIPLNQVKIGPLNGETMIANQQTITNKIHVILQRSLVEARNLALSKKCEQIFDLADAFEIIPSLLLHWEDSYLDLIQTILENYQAKYQETAYDYLSILNMEDQSFEEVFSTTGLATI